MVANLAEAQNHPITPEAFLKHDAEIRTAKREMEDKAAELARVKKAAKKDAISPVAYKMMETLRKLEDDERPVVVRLLNAYCEWVGMPIGTQASLMDAPKVPKPKPAAKAEHNTWAAGEAGLLAGREGDPASDNPHRYGTEQHVAWSKKHSEGLAERVAAEEMGDTEHERVADTATATRRGRRSPAAIAKAEKNLNGIPTAH
jgi:hypothetical protein